MGLRCNEHNTLYKVRVLERDSNAPSSGRNPDELVEFSGPSLVVGPLVSRLPCLVSTRFFYKTIEFAGGQA